MTAKQQVMLIAAQYSQLARDITRQGDAIGSMAKLLDEDGAKEVISKLRKMGLVDNEGLLTPGAAPGAASGAHSGLP